jgi:drug/metabolite transporter (DMT)-like permease
MKSVFSIADEKRENSVEYSAVFYGLACAVTWGAGDFSGGMAVKRTNPYGAVIAAHAISLVMLLTLGFITGEVLPPVPDLLWGCVAGVGGGIGLALLYSALASGQMSIASPVSALVAAALPVFVGSFSDGFPGVWALVGFVMALGAVWLISGGVGLKLQPEKLFLPLLSGVCFAAFFIFLDRGSGQSILWPLVATRIASIISLLSYSVATRQPWIPTRDSWFPIIMSSLLDSAGNALYAMSARMGRMDAAAVLGSLYPGSTVLLAWFILKERVSPLQMAGIAVALIAIVLITL